MSEKQLDPDEGTVEEDGLYMFVSIGDEGKEQVHKAFTTRGMTLILTAVAIGAGLAGLAFG
ncbi:MAG: hypothetical protein AAB955_03215 [Patescibacteria group bacterium]